MISALDNHGDALAAADTKRRQPQVEITPAHLMKQRDQDARAARANGMSESDCAAVDVGDFRVQA